MRWGPGPTAEDRAAFSRVATHGTEAGSLVAVDASIATVTGEGAESVDKRRFRQGASRPRSGVNEPTNPLTAPAALLNSYSSTCSAGPAGSSPASALGAALAGDDR
jgi:hypothetical protein